MMKFVQTLKRDSAGAAAVDFALWCSLFFIVALGALDFGDYFIKHRQVEEAQSATAIYAFNNRTNVPFSGLAAYAQNLAADPAMKVAYSCNGSSTCANSSRSCACLKTTGTYVAAACTSACTGSHMTANSTAGYYLTISASKTYSPMVLPKSILAGSSIKVATTIRLE